MSIKIASLALDLPKCRRIGFWEVETASGYANHYLHLGDRGQIPLPSSMGIGEAGTRLLCGFTASRVMIRCVMKGNGELNWMG